MIDQYTDRQVDRQTDTSVVRGNKEVNYYRNKTPRMKVT